MYCNVYGGGSRDLSDIACKAIGTVSRRRRRAYHVPACTYLHLKSFAHLVPPFIPTHNRPQRGCRCAHRQPFQRDVASLVG